MEQLEKNHAIIRGQIEGNKLVLEVSPLRNPNPLFEIHPIGGRKEKKVILLDGEFYYLKYDSSDSDSEGNILYADIRPSVNEVMTSVIVRHSDIGDRIRCADYRLVQVDGISAGKDIFATLSKDIYEEDEVEFFLSGLDYRQCLILKQVYFNGADRSPDILVYFLAEHLGKERAQDYMVTLSAFDNLMGNPRTSKFGVNINTLEITPVNMGWGRCFSTRYTKSLEDEIKNDPTIMEDKEKLDSISKVSPSDTWYTDNEVKKYNFKPFKLDMNAIEEELKKIEEQCKGTDCEFYSKVLHNGIINQLNSKKGILWMEQHVPGSAWMDLRTPCTWRPEIHPSNGNRRAYAELEWEEKR